MLPNRDRKQIDAEKETSYLKLDITKIYHVDEETEKSIRNSQLTSSIKGDSLFNWEKDEPFGRIDPVNGPLLKPDLKYDVSDCKEIFCWLRDDF